MEGDHSGSSVERAETRRISEEQRQSKAVSAVSSQSPPPTSAPSQAPPPIPQSEPVAAPAPAVAQEKGAHRHFQAPYPPQQSYQLNTYQYAPQPYYSGHAPRPVPIVVPYDKTWMQVKLALTAFSVAFNIILLTLACIIAASSLSPISTSEITGYWAIPFSLIVLIWNFAELITICACGTRGAPEGAASTGVRVRRGIHPGAHVGVNLVIWLVAIFCIFAATLALTEADDQRETCERVLTGSSRYYGYHDCNKTILIFLNTSNYIPMLRTITAFICLITAIHFVLFCRACVETHERNRQQRVLIIPQPMYYGAPQGMMPHPGPSTYQMLPPQTPVARGNHKLATTDEKKALPLPPQDQQGDYGSLAGFYAPSGPQTRTRDFAVSPAPRQPTVASSSRQPPQVDPHSI